MSEGPYEVEEQRWALSDERLKQAIAQTEGALASLREISEGEVEEQSMRWSDERLKQAIEQTEGALASLSALTREQAAGS